jgi:hypothetical protein
LGAIPSRNHRMILTFSSTSNCLALGMMANCGKTPGRYVNFDGVWQTEFLTESADFCCTVQRMQWRPKVTTTINTKVVCGMKYLSMKTATFYCSWQDFNPFSASFNVRKNCQIKW